MPAQNGIWKYVESDAAATFSALLNLLGDTVRTQILTLQNTPAPWAAYGQLILASAASGGTEMQVPFGSNGISAGTITRPGSNALKVAAAGIYRVSAAVRTSAGSGYHDLYVRTATSTVGPYTDVAFGTTHRPGDQNEAAQYGTIVPKLLALTANTYVTLTMIGAAGATLVANDSYLTLERVA